MAAIGDFGSIDSCTAFGSMHHRACESLVDSIDVGMLQIPSIPLEVTSSYVSQLPVTISSPRMLEAENSL
jgi:hypothetical protein